jgi:hypothetical protein
VKLYRIAFTDRKSGEGKVRWAGTQAAAKAAFKELVAEHDRFNVDQPAPVDVPTDKPGLLAWLNDNANVDQEGPQ